MSKKLFKLIIAICVLSHSIMYIQRIKAMYVDPSLALDRVVNILEKKDAIYASLIGVSAFAAMNYPTLKKFMKNSCSSMAKLGTEAYGLISEIMEEISKQQSKSDLLVEAKKDKYIVEDNIKNQIRDAINLAQQTSIFELDGPSLESTQSHGIRSQIQQREIVRQKLNSKFTSIMLYIINANYFYKKAAKEINIRNSEEQKIAALINKNPLTKTYHNRLINTCKELLNTVASKSSERSEIVAALLELNNFELSGREGRKLKEFIPYLNSFFFDIDGNLLSTQVDYKSLNWHVDNFIKNISTNDNTVLQKLKTMCLKDKSVSYIVDKFRSSIPSQNINRSKYAKLFYDIIELSQADFSKENPLQIYNQIQNKIDKYKQSSSSKTTVQAKVLEDFFNKVFDEHGMLRVYHQDPMYNQASIKKMSDEQKNTFIKQLAGRYNLKENIRMNLHIASPSIQANILLYKFVDSKASYSQALKILEDFVSKKTNQQKQEIYKEFFNSQGILRPLEYLTALYPQLTKMPNLFQNPKAITILNQFLLFQQNKENKRFIEIGINYIKASATNSKYLNLAQAYYNLPDTNLPDFTRSYRDQEQAECHKVLLNQVLNISEELQSTNTIIKDFAKFKIQALDYAQNLIDLKALPEASKSIEQISNLMANESNIELYQNLTAIISQYKNTSAAYESDSLLRLIMVHGLDSYKLDKLFKSERAALSRLEILLEKHITLTDEEKANSKYLIEAAKQAYKLLEEIALNESDTSKFDAVKADLLSRISYGLTQTSMPKKFKTDLHNMSSLYNDCVDYNENILKCAIETEKQKPEACGTGQVVEEKQPTPCGTSQIPATEIEQRETCVQETEQEAKTCGFGTITKKDFETWVCNFSKQFKDKKDPILQESELSDGIFGKYVGRNSNIKEPRIEAKKARTMQEFFDEFEFGKKLDKLKILKPTKLIYDGKRVYEISKKFDHQFLEEGDLIYLDNLHKDHFEVFTKTRKFKGVINLDGSYNQDKSQKGFDEKRKFMEKK